MALFFVVTTIVVSTMVTLFILNKSQAVSLVSLNIDQIIIPLETTSSNKASGSKTPAFLNALTLDKLRVDMDISSTPAVFHLSLAEFNLPEPYQHLRNLQFSCQSLEMEPGFIHCQGQKISLFGLLPEQTAESSDFSFRYSFAEQQLVLTINDINTGKGKISIHLKLFNDQWLVDFNADQLAFKDFKPYFEYYYPEFMNSVSDERFGLSASGHLQGVFAKDNIKQEVEQSGGLKQLKIKGKVRNLHYSYSANDTDNLAEKLSFNFRYTSDAMTPRKTQTTLTLNRIKGELLQNDIYLSFTGKEKLYLKLLKDNINNSLKFNRIKLTIDKLLDIEASAELTPGSSSVLQDFHIAYTLNDLQSLNDLYLKNSLEGTEYEGLLLEGKLKGFFGRRGRKIQLNTILNELYLDFNQKIAVTNLNGELNWNNHKNSVNSPVSHINWEEIQLAKLPFGTTRLKFVAFSDQLKLLQETDIPLFDGALHINSLQLNRLGEPVSEQDKSTGMIISIDGLIKPVSLKLISEHFNWPLLDGKLSAVIPETTYTRHRLTVGGAMMMRVFDGNIIFKDLKIDHPLDERGRFFANIDLLNLDLKSLTKTFNFGEIEGRMDGKIRNLELYNWSPVAFNASFGTPKNDESRHRISQKAIDNLSSLGGASGILSRSFLSVFETFRYDKIGLSCRLKNNTCYMDGVEPKGDNAYYIVKGSGLPRIDVMGFQKAVNWEVLINRLKNIQSANEAVIE